MYKRKMIVVVGVRVGSVDSVDSNQAVEFQGSLLCCLCGESWGLTLGNP